ncbi:meiotic recombination [Tieghemiomyces parasiticus]|uniref:Meiotic recombination n=1 Tax=Tieghemiomyces parasiticus TaxID=78921 RepID=A0A9W7ZX58_9FUNG|nr:meiotic recombination [Tieghemiomyces parasiticus]
MNQGVVADSQDRRNALRILLATDNHLGYMEKDPIRGDDSFLAFEEILRVARDQEVDMILLGGDLFHDNRPSRKTLHTTMRLLREYCLGDRPCAIQFRSDATRLLENSFGSVNYQDPNLNVAIPVFTIHGNHDDPTGDGNLSAIDLLSVTGLINYFGKAPRVDQVDLVPLLLQKGTTHLALYGLGNIRDERLHRTFTSQKVRTVAPPSPSPLAAAAGYPEDPWFNLMVLHQNRVQHGPTCYIPEEFLDPRFHLVMWGHEHECRIDPEPNSARGFAITQPGSSVATSLCEGEARAKHVALLTIQGPHQYDMSKVRLRYVRPFIMEDVALRDVPGLQPFDEKATMAFLETKVNEMIDRARAQWREALGGLTEQEAAELELPTELEAMRLPLIRLRVNYSGGYTAFNPQRFGMTFTGRVANPRDLVYYFRLRPPSTATVSTANSLKMTTENGTGVAGGGTEQHSLPSGGAPDADAVCVEDLIDEFLDGDSLEVFVDKELNEAVRLFVDKEEPHAILSMVEKSIGESREHLKRRTTIVDDLQLKRELGIVKAEKSRQYEPLEFGGQGDGGGGSGYKKGEAIEAEASGMRVTGTDSYRFDPYSFGSGGSAVTMDVPKADPRTKAEPKDDEYVSSPPRTAPARKSRKRQAEAVSPPNASPSSLSPPPPPRRAALSRSAKVKVKLEDGDGMDEDDYDHSNLDMSTGLAPPDRSVREASDAAKGDVGSIRGRAKRIATPTINKAPVTKRRPAAKSKSKEATSATATAKTVVVLLSSDDENDDVAPTSDSSSKFADELSPGGRRLPRFS